MSSDSSESEVEWEEVEPLQGEWEGTLGQSDSRPNSKLAAYICSLIAAGGESTEPLTLDGSQGQESGVSAGAGGLEIVLQGAALLGKGKRSVSQSGTGPRFP